MTVDLRASNIILYHMAGDKFLEFVVAAAGDQVESYDIKDAYIRTIQPGGYSCSYGYSYYGPEGYIEYIPDSVYDTTY